jgi:GT2 family glycosyltransferase/glycosyltransferase involved in cell wall biosynthesis/SAM-dependent methyltransferase
MDLPFTGERVIPGKVESDLWAEHLARYLFAEPLAHGRRVLDLGAGAGYGAERLSRVAKSVVAIDVATDAMRYARQHHPGLDVRHLVARGEALPFRAGSFDLVVAFEILEHVHDQPGLLAEVRRVLTPEGIFAVSTPNRLYYTDERHEHNEFHVHEFEVPELQQFLAPAFPQVRIYVQNHVPTVVIGEAGHEGLEAAHAWRAQVEPVAEAHRTCHYAIAVCSSQAQQLDPLVFFPEAQGNVLREREKHVKALQAEVASRDQSLSELRADWEQRGTWARTLDEELQRAQGDFRRVEAEWRERTEWAKSAAAEAQAAREDAASKQAALETANTELVRTHQRAEGLERRKDELERRKDELERRKDELERRKDELERRKDELERGEIEMRKRHAELEQQVASLKSVLDRTAGRRLRRLLTSTRKAVFAMTLAAAAVPISVALGVAALAVEALARLRPRRRRNATAIHSGPRLATIQILNFEGRDLLERNLPSVLTAVAQTGQPHEVLVVDNGSTDGSVEMLREKFPQVKVVPLDRNYFFSRGNNQGAPHASGDILVLLNNDMRVEPDFLPPLLAPFSDPGVFAVSSQIFFPPGAKAREETGLTRARFVHGMLEYSHDPVPANAPRLIPILWGGGGSCAFDKAKWDELRGFDEMYDPFYCEDLDLSLRAWQRGWKVLLAPASKVWHEHRATSRRFFGETFVNETFRRNSYLLHWKNLRDPALLASHLLHLPFLAARDVDRHGWSGARSFLKAIKRAPRALRQRFDVPADARSEARTLEDTNLARPDALFREPKKLREGAPLKITLVTPYHFWPIEHGGAVRMYHVARELARRGHEISVVGFVDTDEQREAAHHLESFCAEVRLIKRGAPEPRRDWGSTPVAALHFDKAELHRELNGLIGRRDPDVIQIEYTQMAGYGRAWPRAAMCLTEHDVAFVSLYRQARQEHGLRRAEAHLDYLRTFRYELEALRRFDLVLTVSEADATLLRGYLRNGVHLSSAGRIGVDEKRYGALVHRPDANRLLFVGFFQHRPNVDAVLWFAREVLPLIHAQNPDVRLDLVGKGAPAEVQRLAEDPRITLHGFAPDLAPHYASAAIFIAPVRTGSGVRVKLLEAFSAGVPVVATPTAAEGLEVTDGREISLGESAQAFADRVLSLLKTPAEAEALAQRARRFVHENYGWAQIAAELEAEYRAALRRKELVE